MTVNVTDLVLTMLQKYDETMLAVYAETRIKWFGHLILSWAFSGFEI